MIIDECVRQYGRELGGRVGLKTGLPDFDHVLIVSRRIRLRK